MNTITADILRPSEVFDYMDRNTHKIVRPELAEHLAKVLNIEVSPGIQEFTHESGEYHLHGEPSEDTIEGISIFWLAPFMCKELGLSTDHGMLGRGSGVRVLVDRLRQHFGIK